MTRTSVRLTAVLFLGAFGAVHASAGCATDPVPPKERVAGVQQAIPDGCPIGSDAQNPKPTGTCVWSYKAWWTQASANIFSPVCVSDNTLRCDVSCPCDADRLITTVSGCQAGANLLNAACATAPSHSETDVTTITLPNGTTKCGDRSQDALLDLCSLAWSGGGNSVYANGTACNSLCMSRTAEGILSTSGPQLCCIPQPPPPAAASSSGTGGSSGGTGGSGTGGSGTGGSGIGGSGTGGAGGTGGGGAGASPGIGGSGGLSPSYVQVSVLPG